MKAERQPVSQKLRLAVIAPFSAPAIPLSALGLAVAVYLPPYFASHLGVSLAAIGLVWGLVRVLDLPVDLFLAVGMDRTRTRFGRYRLWLVGGVPILMFALYKLFMAPRGFSSTYLFTWLLAMYLGTSIVGLAHQAWAATLTRDYHERSRLFAVINAVGIIGVIVAMTILIGAPALKMTDAQSVRACGWFVIAMTPACVLLAALRAPEHIEPDAAAHSFRLKDYWQILAKPDMLRMFLAQISLTLGPGWMSALYLFFFKASRGFTTQQASILLALYILAGIPGAFATAWIARRIGKHRTLMLTTTAYSLILANIFILPKGSLLAFAPLMFLEGAVASGFGMMVQAMLADVGDEIRLEQGRQRMSLVYAVNTLAAKIAGAGAIALAFPLLQVMGFNPAEGVVNSVAAIHRLNMAFVAGPIVFVMLGGVCVIGWKLDAARHGVIRAQLEARDAELDLAAAQGSPAVYSPPGETALMDKTSLTV